MPSAFDAVEKPFLASDAKFEDAPGAGAARSRPRAAMISNSFAAGLRRGIAWPSTRIVVAISCRDGDWTPPLPGVDRIRQVCAGFRLGAAVFAAPRSPALGA